MKPMPRRYATKYGPALDQGRDEILSHVAWFLKQKHARGYIVGGFLRDMLLGISSKDIDLVVDGVESVRLASYLHSQLGLSRPVIYSRFKTALTVGRGFKVEVCGLERNLKEDAARRDFTLNCLYSEVSTRAGGHKIGKVLDPTGRGREDLGRGMLRTPVDACTTLWLDPLRILRAFRLGAVRGFRLDGDLRRAVPRLAFLLSRMAPERVRGEVELILLSSRVISTFRAMQATGVCAIVLPEVSRMHGFDQSTPYHDYDLLTHTLKATARAPADVTLRLAALLHDVGKPATRTMKGDRAVYYGHEEVSAELAGRVLRRLKFSRRIVEHVLFLVSNHMILYSGDWTDKAVRRFIRKMGPHLEDMLLLAEADQKAQVAEGHPGFPAARLRKRIGELREGDGIHLGLPIDGNEIMSVLGIDEGPLVGRAKNRLFEEALDRDRPMSRQEALEVLKKWAKSQELQ